MRQKSFQRQIEEEAISPFLCFSVSADSICLESIGAVELVGETRVILCGQKLGLIKRERQFHIMMIGSGCARHRHFRITIFTRARMTMALGAVTLM